ncbi:hypothetical protein KUCAC02_014551 [Chaenocephalus aceratus]|uniref:Uncharacterized protein n=1 Tax=Chaenocephalus aceratus TaxID=36190 RepID=A0ACB9WE56_CHAAC|nr:hypothetical protein KUCAC02_014551 [Chaenocephalus aceratus]
MGDWNFLGGILEEVHIHSTMVGKIWLHHPVHLPHAGTRRGSRGRVERRAGRTSYATLSKPGCRNVCYDHAFPISLIRYWVLQVHFCVFSLAGLPWATLSTGCGHWRRPGRRRRLC